jgi:hypothetical protein
VGAGRGGREEGGEEEGERGKRKEKKRKERETREGYRDVKTCDIVYGQRGGGGNEERRFNGIVLDFLIF